MPFALEKLVQARYLNLPIEEILDLPTHAIKGVSESDADHLQQAFGIERIRDFGNNRLFQAAAALTSISNAIPFDAGPPPFWQDVFKDAPVDYYLNHPADRFRIDFGPVYYRGRLDNTARVLILGQDPSTDEILAQRAFVGASGQRLQRFLNKVGINRSYLILNTFLFSIFDQFDNEMEAISLEDEIRDYRHRLLDTAIARNPIEAIITLGNGPRHAIQNWNNPTGLTIFNLVHPAAPEATAFPSWNTQLPLIEQHLTADDSALVDLSIYEGSWRRSAHVAEIPRYDLNFGVPSWHGTRGTRSGRGPGDHRKNITWTAI